MPQATAQKPLDRAGFLQRVVSRPVTLADGCVVCIRALSAHVIVNGAEDAAKIFDPANLLVNSLCDENGALLFTTEEKAQAMAIDHVALKTILEAVMELNGLMPPKDGEVGYPEKN